MKNIKKIVLMLVVAILICGWAVVSLAETNTGNVDDVVDIEDRTNNASKPPVNNANTNTNTNSNTNTRNNLNTLLNANKNTNTNTNTNTTLPKTGVNDTAMWLLVAIFGIATFYTYKKVRDYNV